MLGPAGLALGDHSELGERSGVLTPMSALRAPDAERLRQGSTVFSERLTAPGS